MLNDCFDPRYSICHMAYQLKYCTWNDTSVRHMKMQHLIGFLFQSTQTRIIRIIFAVLKVKYINACVLKY